MHQLNNLDVILIILTLLSMLVSWSRGLVKEVLSIIGWILASVFIFYLLPYFTPFVKTYIAGSLMAIFVAALILLIVFYILWFLATFKFLKTLRKSKLSSIDRALGVIFGALRIFLLVILFNILLEAMLPEINKKPIFEQSHYYTAAASFSEPLQKLIPEETIQKIKEKSKIKSENLTTDPEELFKKLSKPQTKKIEEKKEKGTEKEKSDNKETKSDDKLSPADEKAKESFKGYNGSEVQSLDRLIETTVE